MSLSSDLVLVVDIRQSASLIGDYVAGLDQQDFEADWMRRDATAFRLLLIGEAVSKLSPELVARLPEIDWPGMISLRDRLVHDYGSANFSVLWAIVSDDVPRLSEALAGL